MANVTNHMPTAADIARVVRVEAAKLLEGDATTRTPEECFGAAFATSQKDRPRYLSPPCLLVLLAEAVIRQSRDVDRLTAELAEVRRAAAAGGLEADRNAILGSRGISHAQGGGLGE